MAGLLWFLSYCPFFFLQKNYDDLNLTQKLFACLGSNTAMAYGMQFIVKQEGTGEGKFSFLILFSLSILISIVFL